MIKSRSTDPLTLLSLSRVIKACLSTLYHSTKNRPTFDTSRLQTLPRPRDCLRQQYTPRMMMMVTRRRRITMLTPRMMMRSCLVRDSSKDILHCDLVFSAELWRSRSDSAAYLSSACSKDFCNYVGLRKISFLSNMSLQNVFPVNLLWSFVFHKIPSHLCTLHTAPNSPHSRHSFKIFLTQRTSTLEIHYNIEIFPTEGTGTDIISRLKHFPHFTSLEILCLCTDQPDLVEGDKSLYPQLWGGRYWGEYWTDL